MATRCAAATGNASAAGTWGLCVAGAENDSQAATVAVTNVTQSSATFTGLSDVVDAILLEPSSRPGSSGTFTAKLRNVTDGTDAATVTINITDIPSATIQGLLCLQFAASPVTLNPAKTYRIDYIASANGLLVLYASTASAANVSRFLRSTATGAPAAGDKLLVCAEHTGAGASTPRTVTIDADLGIGGFAISDGGTVTCPRTASINRTLTLSGYTVDAAKRGIWCYSGGTFDGGSVASPIPASSTLTVVLNVASNVEFGIEAPGGVFQMAGDPAFRTTQRAFLTVDAGVSDTVLNVSVNMGLKAGDQIALPSTTRTAAQNERRTIASDQVGLTITVSAGLSFAHSGSNSGGYDTRAMVLGLTSNVTVRGASSLLQGYISIGVNGSGVLDSVTVTRMGSATTGKRGIDISGTFTISRCGLYEFGVDSTYASTVAGAFFVNINSSATCTLQNNNLSGTSNTGIVVNANTVTQILDGNWIVQSIGVGINSSDSGSTYTNNRVAGCNSIGFAISEAASLGTFSGNVSHSNASNGFSFTSLTGGSASNCSSWRNNSTGISLNTLRGTFSFDGWREFDSAAISIQFNNCAGVFNITNGVFGALAGSGFTTGSGISAGSTTAVSLILVENCSFGQSVAYTQLINQVGNFIQAVFRYCLIGATSDVQTPSTMLYGSFVGFSYYNQTQTHRYYTRNGLREFVPGGGIKLTPTQTRVTDADKMDTGPLDTPCKSGQAMQMTVHVLKSASYNGSQPRVVAKANASLGINTDTVLQTAAAANGVDETVSWTFTPTADGVLKLVVDADGTAGNVQVTRFTAAGGPIDWNGSMEYSVDGYAYPVVVP